MNSGIVTVEIVFDADVAVAQGFETRTLSTEVATHSSVLDSRRAESLLVIDVGFQRVKDSTDPQAEWYLLNTAFIREVSNVRFGVPRP